MPMLECIKRVRAGLDDCSDSALGRKRLSRPLQPHAASLPASGKCDAHCSCQGKTPQDEQICMSAAHLHVCAALRQLKAKTIVITPSVAVAFVFQMASLLSGHGALHHCC